MILGKTKRPRNVDSSRAAAILYGDWGTSKAYVIGLAFAVGFLTAEDRKRQWMDDPEARKIFAYTKKKADGHPILPCYTVSDVPAHTIVDLALNVGASHLILGAPRRSMLVKLVRGNLIRQVSRFLPEDIHLLVYA